ncbi:MAG TPA: phosphatidate cytidylyltransferase [Prolixibacteraceae bacterium]|nr:phosphatidate cytidylyltransferase [Prolixibacteraceae bacterium]
MKNLLIRALSGGIFVILTIGSILISKYTFFGFFGILLTYTLYEFYRLCRSGDNQPQMLSGIIISLYLFTAFFLYDLQIVGEVIFFGLVPLIMLSPIIEIFSKSEKPVQNIAYTFIGILYIAVPFSILYLIMTPYKSNPGLYMPEVLIGLFLILWANDTGAYLVGSCLGKTKMIERISPKKTWEGAIGGAMLAIIVSVLLFNYLDFLNWWQVILLALITVITGTLGDLTESLFKRSFNVKDTGNILPGHGGLLDRLDSLLFAAPAYFVFISIILNN